jgi:hypothetical protein
MDDGACLQGKCQHVTLTGMGPASWRGLWF